MADYPILVVIETQRIKGYLFASRLLRETRGASLLLDRLNRGETRTLVAKHGGREVYLGGGSGRVLFQDEMHADEFAREVRELYRRNTWDARVSVVVAGRVDGESFTEWVRRAVEESNRSKQDRVEAMPLLGGRWIRPCSSCGREPAQHIPLPDVQGAHQLCRSCRAKRDEVHAFYRRDKGRLERSQPIPAAEELRRRRPDFVLTTLAEEVERRFAGARTLLPQDFDDIGERSRPSNYSALIYADGNRMGEVIRGMGRDFPGDEAEAAYRAFSEIVDRATREAAVEAVLAEVGAGELRTEKGEPGRLVPAEFVLAGGDDLILVVPAQAALGVAERFVSLYQASSLSLQDEWIAARRLARRFAPDGLTTSAGVLIAHASYPASQLVELAAELMKLAKRKAADLAHAGTATGTVDFAVLHESTSEGIRDQRRAEYEASLPSGTAVRRTERPYSAAELSALCERIRALKSSGVARSKLKALYAALFRSPIEAQFDALRLKERLQATGDLDQPGPLSDLVAELTFFPFREIGKGLWSTPLSEIVELYDFVPEDTAVGAAGGGEAGDA